EVHGAGVLVPFMFVLQPAGQGLLLMGSLENLAAADWSSIAWVTFTAAVGIASIAAGFQGWAFKRTNVIERWLLIIAGFSLVLSRPVFDMIGFGCVIAGLALQLLRREQRPAAPA
ncbi:MAG: TRAP transporter permease, partial [Burkholderiaceae bacterium]